ncbi:MAG: tetratricopeptide repeat protein, partial [Acidobacteriaceae bacterium]|nr:tetratricopeptide repeat protein [Acidobacteriaceae bacterium]
LLLWASVSLMAWATPDPSPAALLSVGRADDAIMVLRARTSANPNDAEAYHLLSRTYFYMERWDEAADAAEHAATLNPDRSEYQLWLGRTYGEKAAHVSFVRAVRMVPKIRGAFERAVELNAANVDARADLAEFYLEAPAFLGGGKDKALAQADKLLPQDPAAAHWLRGKTAEKDKRYTEAEAEYVAAIKTSKTPAARWLDLAAFYRQIGRLEMMQNAINRAISAEAGPSAVLYDAASMLVRSDRNFPQAIELVRQYLNSSMVEEAPAYRAHYLLGSIFEKQGNKTAAAAEYRSALSLARQFEQAQSALRRVE